MKRRNAMFFLKKRTEGKKGIRILKNNNMRVIIVKLANEEHSSFFTKLIINYKKYSGT